MKSAITLAALLISFTGNAAELKCFLYQNNNVNSLVAKVESEFSDGGDLVISERDNILSNPKASRYAFSATVDSGELTSIRLTDKTLGISTEHKTFEGDLMKITLEAKGMITNFEC